MYCKTANKRNGLFLFIPLLCCIGYSVYGQDTTSNQFGNGITIKAADESFSMKFSTRIQTLYEGILDMDNNDYVDKIQIRRARLKFDGHAYSPKLTYKIELGLTNRDHSGGDIPQSGNTSRMILDAVLKYNFYKNWSVWLGQTKLPGNIERVISSQQLQLVDRSTLNSRYNIDRDIGLQLHYEGTLFHAAGAISQGEGRDITADNLGGYDYTLRAEILPLGKFKGKPYSGSDLDREPKPKIQIGVTYDYNDRAERERGQLGDFVSETTLRSLSTVFADAHFKYNGWSCMLEYANKQAPDGADALDEEGNATRYFVGTGFNVQLGYLFTNNFEVAGRFTEISPEVGNENVQYTLGVSKYIVGHSLKVQSDLTYITQENSTDKLMYRFQVELAF